MNTNRKLDDAELSMISGAGENVHFSRGKSRSDLYGRQVFLPSRPGEPVPKGVDIVLEGTGGAGYKIPIG